MKRSFQQALFSPLGLWTGTGLVVAAVATIFLNGSTVLQAIHSPLVTTENKSWARCVLRVWDANEQLNINTECGERPRRWIWEGSENCSTAELPLRVLRNGRTFLEVCRLLIGDTPDGHHAIFEVAMLQRHPLLVVGGIEAATPFASGQPTFEPAPNLGACVSHSGLS